MHQRCVYSTSEEEAPTAPPDFLLSPLSVMFEWSADGLLHLERKTLVIACPPLYRFLLSEL
jgi:hypothetical protein